MRKQLTATLLFALALLLPCGSALAQDKNSNLDNTLLAYNVQLRNSMELFDATPLARLAAFSGPVAKSTTNKPVKLTATSPHSTTVQWSDVDASSALGYFIYKGTTSGGESNTPLNATPIDVGTVCNTAANLCQFVDNAVVAGAHACYTVAANNGSTTTAKASPDACVDTPFAAPVLAAPISN